MVVFGRTVYIYFSASADLSLICLVDFHVKGNNDSAVVGLFCKGSELEGFAPCQQVICS